MNSRICLDTDARATLPRSSVGQDSQRSYRAVVVERSGPRIVERPLERGDAGDVLIRVESLGLCRTDLRVYQGEIPAAFPLIPGHEFSGVVEQTGASVEHLSAGDRVVVNPVLSCGNCIFCEQQQCPETKFLGLDIDGACAEYCKLPSSTVYKIPDTMPFEVAAFAEPVAACLAVLNADITTTQRGVLLGDNRIATLTQRILRAHHFDRVQQVSAEQLAMLPSHSFDFAIETFATTETIQELVRSVRPNGLVVLKSRQQVPIELNLAALLPKNIRFQCVNYGSFQKAIDLLATAAIDVSDLIGPAYGLSQYAEAFDDASNDESSKVFIRPQVETIDVNGDR